MLVMRLREQFRVQRDGTPIAIPSRHAQPLPVVLLLTCGRFPYREKLARHFRPDPAQVQARHLRQALKQSPQPTQSSLSLLGVEHFFQLHGSVTQRGYPNAHRLFARA